MSVYHARRARPRSWHTEIVTPRSQYYSIKQRTEIVMQSYIKSKALF